MNSLNTTSGFHGIEREILSQPDIRVVRVTHPAGQNVPAHRHDRACLTIFLCGQYVERFDSGEIAIASPAAVLYPGGRDHADVIGPNGLETVSLQFEPAILRIRDWSKVVDRTRACNGGAMSRAASRLAKRLGNEDAQLYCRVALAGFLQCAFTGRASAGARWSTCRLLDAAKGCVHRYNGRRLHRPRHGAHMLVNDKVFEDASTQ